ncbi:MAG: peptide deformylase [Ignavibacteriae bacterium]|nr:peptide deformylase [Ignavibacteria bacterium]MBI3364424.1 peptide deformylase [Ignavibacteriota bacterium]
MAVLPIYTYGTSVLRKKAKAVHKIDDEIIKLVMDMFETMRKANGIGLAANQVGSLRRVIVIDISDVEEYKDTKPLVLINPEVFEQEGTWVIEEGCLSIPDVRDEVERAERITVRFKDMNFEEVTLEVSGLLGRVILHEIDHINGILFLDHLSPKMRKAHNEELKKIRRSEMEVSYPVVTSVTVEV